MSDQIPNQISLYTLPDVDSSRGSYDFVAEKVDLSVLRDRFREFVAQLQSIVEFQEEDTGDFTLTEVQFSAEIAANGEFKLMGSGVGVEVGSAVTFVLKRGS